MSPSLTSLVRRDETVETPLATDTTARKEEDYDKTLEIKGDTMTDPTLKAKGGMLPVAGEITGGITGSVIDVTSRAILPVFALLIALLRIL